MAQTVLSLAIYSPLFTYGPFFYFSIHHPSSSCMCTHEPPISFSKHPTL